MNFWKLAEMASNSSDNWLGATLMGPYASNYYEFGNPDCLVNIAIYSKPEKHYFQIHYINKANNSLQIKNQTELPEKTIFQGHIQHAFAQHRIFSEFLADKLLLSKLKNFEAGVPILIYADFLEEHGHDQLAMFARDNTHRQPFTTVGNDIERSVMSGSGTNVPSELISFLIYRVQHPGEVVRWSQIKGKL